MPIKRYNGTSWDVIAGDGLAGAEGASGQWGAVGVSSNITLNNYTNYFVDTSTARTLTLPASPSLGWEIHVFDATGSSATNNITVLSNSLKINGSVQDLTIDQAYAGVVLIYTGSNYGWKVS